MKGMRGRQQFKKRQGTSLGLGAGMADMIENLSDAANNRQACIAAFAEKDH